jgi:hypothetical protein
MTRELTARNRAILAALSACPAGMTSRDLMPLYGNPAPPAPGDDYNRSEWQHAMSRCSLDLSRLASHGYARRVGKLPGAWQVTPVTVWQVTGAGRDAAARPPRPSRAAAIAAARRAARARGAGLSRSARGVVAAALREQGCTYDEIGSALGISHEQARQDFFAYHGLRTEPASPKRGLADIVASHPM